MHFRLNLGLKRIRNFAFLGAVLGITTGCTSLRASPAATTPFLSHASELHPWYEHAPWDAVWSSDPGNIMVLVSQPRKIFVPPVSLAYLNKKKIDSGEWVSVREVDASDSAAIAELVRKSFIDAIRSHPETNLQLQDNPGPDILNLELALVELAPTKVVVNGVADVGGLLIPGSKAIEDAANVGVQAAGGAVASGTVAIEMKLTSGSTGIILAEMKDRENDPSSVIPNYRDFEEFGWTRKTVAAWAKQFVEVFSTSADTKVDGPSVISVSPW